MHVGDAFATCIDTASLEEKKTTKGSSGISRTVAHNYNPPLICTLLFCRDVMFYFILYTLLLCWEFVFYFERFSSLASVFLLCRVLLLLCRVLFFSAEYCLAEKKTTQQRRKTTGQCWEPYCHVADILWMLLHMLMTIVKHDFVII